MVPSAPHSPCLLVVVVFREALQTGRVVQFTLQTLVRACKTARACSCAPDASTISSAAAWTACRLNGLPMPASFSTCSSFFPELNFDTSCSAIFSLLCTFEEQGSGGQTT